MSVVPSPTVTTQGPRNATAETTLPCPADILLLSGSCVANEAMLTGESVPQLKDAIVVEDNALNQRLEAFDGFNKHSHNIVFGGTTVSSWLDEPY